MRAWGKHHTDRRNRKEYNEQLVVRGEFYLDSDFVNQWNSEMNEMNSA